ncbi:MAG: hypothetical protein ABIH23_27630 [bacterium]
MKELPQILKSKKAQAVVAGILTVIFGEGLGLDPEAVKQIVGLIMAYAVGQGIADINKNPGK